jgi:hypothetical protein
MWTKLGSFKRAYLLLLAGVLSLAISPFILKSRGVDLRSYELHMASGYAALLLLVVGLVVVWRRYYASGVRVKGIRFLRDSEGPFVEVDVKARWQLTLDSVSLDLSCREKRYIGRFFHNPLVGMRDIVELEEFEIAELGRGTFHAFEETLEIEAGQVRTLRIPVRLAEDLPLASPTVFLPMRDTVVIEWTAELSVCVTGKRPVTRQWLVVVGDAAPEPS